MFNKRWNWVPRYVSANSVPMGKSGHYIYVGASNGTWNIVNAVQIGQNPQDDRQFVVSHMGGDSVVLSITIQGSDRFYEPSVTGAIAQALGSNGLTGQTRSTIQLVKGDVLWCSCIARVWYWYVVRPQARTVSTTTTYQMKPYDNLVLLDTTAGAYTATLPPIATMLINGESRPIEAYLAVLGGANSGTIAPSAGETIQGGNVVLSAVGNKTRLRPVSATVWGVF